MGGNASIGIEFWISVSIRLESSIYNLREWGHLKIAQEDEILWIRGFSETEINNTKVLCLPSVNRFYSKEGNLYPYGKNLPHRSEPNELWTPIERGLQLTLPKENFNFFGVEEKTELKLVPCEIEFPVHAVIIELKSLEQYVLTAPSNRIKNLNWIILEDTLAIIIGQPILPISGIDYYLYHNLLIPTGYQLEHKNLASEINKMLPDKNTFHYFISTKNIISSIRKDYFRILSKGSVITTMLSLAKNSEALKP